MHPFAAHQGHEGCAMCLWAASAHQGVILSYGYENPAKRHTLDQSKLIQNIASPAP